MNINWYYIPSTLLLDGQEKELKLPWTREKAGHVVFPIQVVFRYISPQRSGLKEGLEMRDICELFVYSSPSQNIYRYNLLDSNRI